jgi:hypothetical protein
MAGLIIFITVATFATLLCIVTTTICIKEYAKQEPKNEEEIELLHEEVRARRELLRRKERKGNA